MAPAYSKNEIGLLKELASGAKTFKQVGIDVLRSVAGCDELKRRLKSKPNWEDNVSRTITHRIEEITGVRKDKLQYHTISMKDHEGNAVPVQHPFMSLTSILERLIGRDPTFLEVQPRDLGNQMAAGAGFIIRIA